MRYKSTHHSSAIMRKKNRDQAAQLAPADYEALAVFRYALRRFLNFSGAAARAAGMSPQQHQALLAIKGFPSRHPASIGELAGRMDLRHHSAVGLVDRLVRRGLVRRAADPVDRRCVRLHLTRQGEALLGRLSATHREELRRIGPGLRRILGKL
jgi:DNA-binding MarR family transcriptional regulator